MKGTKEVRRVALALAWADGHDVEDREHVMPAWEWDGYLLSAQDIVTWLAVRGDDPPPVPLIDTVGETS